MRKQREPTVAVVLAPGSRGGGPWRVPRSVGREVTCPLCSGRGDVILPDWMGGVEAGWGRRHAAPLDWTGVDDSTTCPRCRGWGWVYWQGLRLNERADAGDV